jgi:hypothetical protein
VRLATYVREKRPYAKVGFYTLPLREYWNQNEEWRYNMHAIAAIFDACNAVFPSVYDFYGDDSENAGREEDRIRYGNLVRLALELAGDSDVVLYGWHRWQEATEEYGYKLITRGERIDHVRYLLREVEFNGKRPVGLCAWGADDYYHPLAFERNENGSYVRQGEVWDRRRAAFESEMHPGESIEAYTARLHPIVYADLATALAPIPE